MHDRSAVIALVKQVVLSGVSEPALGIAAPGLLFGMQLGCSY